MSTDSEVSERDELLAALRDKSRRHHLASVVTKRGLAEQIREIRLDRGWTQSDLARMTNKVQETISQLENPNYGNYTIKTLQRLAEAFDVKLTVRFDPFSELVRWMTELTPEDLAVPDYDHDPGLKPIPASTDLARATGLAAPSAHIVVNTHIMTLLPSNTNLTSLPVLDVADQLPLSVTVGRSYSRDGVNQTWQNRAQTNAPNGQLSLGTGD